MKEEMSKKLGKLDFGAYQCVAHYLGKRTIFLGTFESYEADKVL
jgi:hypothetical protein